MAACGAIMLGCAAVVFDEARARLLLTRRADNGQWCLPGGRVEAGETVVEACLRELREETGVTGHVTRLCGVYSSPDFLVEYPSGDRVQVVALCFEVEPDRRQIQMQPEEVVDWRWVTAQQAEELDVVRLHLPRIRDAFAGGTSIHLR